MSRCILRPVARPAASLLAVLRPAPVLALPRRLLHRVAAAPPGEWCVLSRPASGSTPRFAAAFSDRADRRPSPPRPEQEVDPDDNSGEVAIYRGVLSTQVKLVKAFSLSTSVLALAFQPLLYEQLQNGKNVGVVLAACAAFSCFTFVTPLLVHYVSKKYVTALYYNRNEDSYTAVTYSLLLRPKKLTFRVKDVEVPEIPGLFTTFKAHKTPLFVEGQLFNPLIHFGKIMGYDKPLDMKMGHLQDGPANKQS